MCDSSNVFDTGFHTVLLYRCNVDASSYAVCGANVTRMDYANSNGTQMLIPGTHVLEQLDVTLPLYAVSLLLIAIGVTFRILAYFALRFLHRKHQ